MTVADAQEGAEERDAARPRATVIVLGYFGWHYIEPCLASLFDQDVPPGEYEVLYVDNASLDGSAARVRERFPQARVLALDRNYGYAEGNNRGYADSRGEVAVFLNEDTVVHRGWLQALLAAVHSAPDVAAAHANIIQPWYPEFAGIDERAAAPAAYTSEVNRLGYIQYRRLASLEGLPETLFLHGVCIALRRSVADRFDYIFDPDFFAYAEDLDLGLRVQALGYRSVVAPRATVYHKHTLKTELSWDTLVKTVRIIRNRYLAFYKVMAGWEFALMVVLMSIGAPLNSAEFGLSRGRQLLYGLALVPVTAVALVVTLLQLPAYAAKRRSIRESAASRGAWCLRALWRA